MERISYEPKIERRREILYGTLGIVIYRDGRPVLWVPDNRFHYQKFVVQGSGSASEGAKEISSSYQP